MNSLHSLSAMQIRSEWLTTITPVYTLSSPMITAPDQHEAKCAWVCMQTPNASIPKVNGYQSYPLRVFSVVVGRVPEYPAASSPHDDHLRSLPFSSRAVSSLSTFFFPFFPLVLSPLLLKHKSRRAVART